MRKNSSPQSIAGIAALVVALFSAIVVSFSAQQVWLSVLNFVAVFVSGYFIFLYLLQEFIYRKIKIIFKNIYQFKTKGVIADSGSVKSEKDPLSKVNKEVIDWMKMNRDEVNNLMEQAAYRREFLGNVSHELKTPVHSVQGYIQTLLDGALEDESVNRLFLNKAAKGVDRLVDLIEDLTSISELESRDINLNLNAFDISELVEEVFDDVSHLSKAKGVTLSYKKGSEKSFNVYADRARIMQVLVNLVVNAIKYGKKKGNVLVGFYDLDKQVLIEVTDDGYGIEEEHLPRLFERFYRTDKGRSRNEGGTGLGLSIVKHIVEAHNQTVNIRSTVGSGSTFAFTLQKA